jgi:hypothetical protein
MGGNKSKLPHPYPGQVLHLTGIENIDNKYKELEKLIRKIKRIRMNIDYRFTDFILELGAAKLWERQPNFREILRMFILVLVINNEKKLESITFQVNFPYLDYKTSKSSFDIKSLYHCFTDYIGAIEGGLSEIQNITTDFDREQNLKDVKRLLDDIFDENAMKYYKTDEKLMVVENVHRNLKIVEETLEFIEKIKNLGDEIKDDIEEIVKECKQSQKIIQRCLQAELERIYKPADIIRKYWPYPLP